MSNFNQTSYSLQHAKAVAGMVADAEASNTVSKVNTATATIPYGRFVARDGDQGMKPLAANSTAVDIVGVTRYELNRAYAAGDVLGVPVDRDGSVLTMGAIYVESIGTVAAGSPVFAVVAQGADTGKVAGAAGSAGTLAVAVTGAIFAEAATAGQLAKVSLKIGG